MNRSDELLKPEFLVIECTSRWTGAYSYILTSCTHKPTVRKACAAAARRLKKEVEQTIDFSCQTVADFINDSDALNELNGSYSDDSDDAIQEHLTIDTIFLPQNGKFLRRILEELFDTGYVNGIIADYVERDDVPVLKSSR